MEVEATHTSCVKWPMAMKFTYVAYEGGRGGGFTPRSWLFHTSHLVQVD